MQDTHYQLLTICKLQHSSYLSLSHTHKALENVLTSCRLSTVIYGFFSYLQCDNTLLHKPRYHIAFWRNNEILTQVILSDVCAGKAPFTGRRQNCVIIKELLGGKHVAYLQTRTPGAKAELSTSHGLRPWWEFCSAHIL